MALSTYSDITGRVQLRCPAASPLLTRDWVTNAFRQIAERRRWSWLMGFGQFLVPAAINAGTVTVTNNSLTITGDATAAAAWSQAIVNRQFRAGASNPIYTIVTVTTVVNPNDTLTLDSVYGGATTVGASYTVWQCYYTVPSDYHAMVTVVDMQNGYQLDRNIGQDYLDLIDPKRTATGRAYALSLRTYDMTVTPPLPRYELWPTQTAATVYPFLYETRATDLQDSGASLPRYIRGDILLEMALAECAIWPGPSVDRPNPYYSLQAYDRHIMKSEQMVAEAMRQDEEVLMQDIRYQAWSTWPLGDSSFMGDAYWQSHAPLYF